MNNKKIKQNSFCNSICHCFKFEISLGDVFDDIKYISVRTLSLFFYKNPGIKYSKKRAERMYHHHHNFNFCIRR